MKDGHSLYREKLLSLAPFGPCRGLVELKGLVGSQGGSGQGTGAGPRKGRGKQGTRLSGSQRRGSAAAPK